MERSNPMGSGNAQTVTSRDPKAVAQAATDMKNVVRRKLTGYVGFVVSIQSFREITQYLRFELE